MRQGTAVISNSNKAFAGVALCFAFVTAGHALTKEEIADRLNGVDPSNISESPIPGIYQIQLGSNVAYVTTDGQYLFQGELYDLTTSQNMTELTRAAARVEMLGEVPSDEMLIFAPQDTDVKHTVTIFTDIDCGYCRQFHREIDQVNALGIEVHYLFYPRTGPNTESWAKADKVWCADERNEAFTKATVAGAVPEEICDATPVGSHFDLGRSVGVTGTPAIIAANGQMIGGYMPPATLLERLESLSE
jgi:thiol:disulfide interchange protein DsbC